MFFKNSSVIDFSQPNPIQLNFPSTNEMKTLEGERISNHERMLNLYNNFPLFPQDLGPLLSISFFMKTQPKTRYQ